MRSRFLPLLPLAFLAALTSLGCSSTSSSNTSDSGAAANPNDLNATFAPIDVPAGVETTQCIVVPLGNTQDVLVQSVEVNLAPGSHHMIVYSTTESARTEPLNCAPFTGIALGTDVPLFFANKEQASFTFPTGIAQEIPANTMVKIAAHYINASMADIQGTGTVTFHTTPKAGAAAYQAANFLFWGNTNISIPPNASFSTGPQFQVAPANTHLFLITTHEHRLGTRAQVWASAQEGDMSTPLADDKDWSNPSWRLLAPQVDFNGTNGLTFQCDWMNTTTQTVSFGESALNEMCFIGGYYYPSQGLSLCVNGQCRHKGH